MRESGIVVNRWRRYGKDRPYVIAPDSVKVGWWDLVSDEPHPESPERLLVLIEAAASWRAEQGVAVAAEVVKGLWGKHG